MKKRNSSESMKDKIINKFINEPAIKKSMEIHKAAFGSIWDQAFEDDITSKIHLTAALNRLQNRDTKGCIEKLEMIHSCCKTDADKAALAYFTGLAYEFMGKMEEMISYYLKAGEYGHSFYLPYLKIAKHAHNNANFDMAEENYVMAIKCLEAMQLNEQIKMLLASAYTNFASCLTMMRRFDEAEKMIKFSEQILKYQQGRSACKAILYAAMGDKEKAEEFTIEVKEQMPPMYEQTKKMTNEILSGKNPQFNEVEPDREKIELFWSRFAENEAFLLELLEEGAIDRVISYLDTQIKQIFPFMNRSLGISFIKRDDGYQLLFKDYYMVALNEGYLKLFSLFPQNLKYNWSFTIER